MGRLIVLVLLVLVAVWLVRRALAPGRRHGGEASAAQEELVRCAHCGIHVPRADARTAGSALYCSDEHARLGPRER